jgi:hypothetical protein
LAVFLTNIQTLRHKRCLAEENFQKEFEFPFYGHFPRFLFLAIFLTNIESGKVDRLHSIVLATSHVALGGEENFQKAFEFLKAMNTGPGSASFATQQLEILKSQRDRILSEGIPKKRVGEGIPKCLKRVKVSQNGGDGNNNGKYAKRGFSKKHSNF